MANLFRQLVDMTGPTTALQEILYGFIMALIFVNATLLHLLNYNNPIDFVWVVVGMNVTWGAIDAVIFYFLGKCDQRRYKRIITNEDKTMSREERVDILVSELSSSPIGILKDEEARIICERMLDREIGSEEELRSERRAMALSSIGAFIFTVLTLVPIVLPVLHIPDFMLALSVANYLSSTILFFVGFYMGPSLGLNRMLSGLTFFILAWATALISTFTGG